MPCLRPEVFALRSCKSTIYGLETAIGVVVRWALFLVAYLCLDLRVKTGRQEDRSARRKPGRYEANKPSKHRLHLRYNKIHTEALFCLLFLVRGERRVAGGQLQNYACRYCVTSERKGRDGIRNR